MPPTHLSMLDDGSDNGLTRRIRSNIPPAVPQTRIKKPGFPFEESPAFRFRSEQRLRHPLDVFRIAEQDVERPHEALGIGGEDEPHLVERHRQEDR